MSQRIRVLHDLGLEFERVIAATPSGPPLRPARRRLIVVAVVIVALALTAVALAAGGVFSSGPAVAPGFGDLTNARGGAGAVLPRSVGAIAAVTADPAGGPSWGMRVLKTTRGLGCIQLGRVIAGRLGVLGQDGAFANDGRFHPLPPQVVENPVDCSPLDTRGHLYLALESQGVPASGYAMGCTPPGDVEPHPNPPICAQRDERAVFAGLLGPSATGVTYATSGGQLRTITPGAGGAYLIVLPADPVRDQGGANLSGLLPSPGNGQPIRRITYQKGTVCQIVGLSPTDQAGRPCTPVGYVAPVIHTPAQSSVAAPVRFRRRINLLNPVHGVREDDLEVIFLARVAVNGATAGYVVDVQLPGTGACRGQGVGTGSAQNIRAGETLRLHMTWAAYAGSYLRCHGRYRGAVYYMPAGEGRDQRPAIRAGPVTARALVGRFSFTVR